MNDRAKSASYSEWRLAQEWLDEWLVARDQGRCEIPAGDALRSALGLKLGAKDQEVESKLRDLAGEPFPASGDASGPLKRLDLVRKLLEEAEESNDDADVSFTCGVCGEPTPIDVDPEDGETQTFTVDCSVCCRPNVIRVMLNADGTPQLIVAVPEQD